jgi:hypothetical protein
MRKVEQSGHPLLPAAAKRRPSGNVPTWPSYKGESKLVGRTPTGKLTVYVDPTLGAEGEANAQSLIQDGDRVIAANDSIFGTTGGPTSVIIFKLNNATDGTGGADHGGCDYQTGAAIEVCAAFGAPEVVSALYEAELSECSMGGDLCGKNTGEALSRWCAAEIGHNALADFATGPAWVAAGKPNFVDKVDDTDQNSDSTGCGMVFLSWLRSLGFSLSQIAPAMVTLGDGGTLAQLYQKLTHHPSGKAWSDFNAAVDALPKPIADDDPFGGTVVAGMHSITAESANRLLGLILESVAAGHSPERMADRLAGALAMSGRSARPPAPVSACTMGSHRLEKTAA